MIVTSYTSPKTLKGKPSAIEGRGFFAAEDIKRGEVTAIKGGHIIDKPTLDSNKAVIRGSDAVIADGLYIAPLEDEEFEKSMIFYNHSCEPNSGYGGNIIFIAMRDIKAGEELTIDYAMHHSEPDFSMICNCKTQNCRKIIKGEDWKNLDLQKKYKGYFSWYIEQKITSNPSV